MQPEISFPFKATCLFDYKGQGMRTDVLLPKSGAVVNVLRCGDAGADKGYNESWYFCELAGSEGWVDGFFAGLLVVRLMCVGAGGCRRAM